MEGTAKDLILALEGLEREKNIKREDILKTIEDALVSALRKNLGKTAQISAKIDVENGSIKAFQTLNVVELVTNPEAEITVEDAKAHLKNPAAGDVVTITLEVEDFSRIAAQIAKQVLIQKVRGIERDNFYKEFKPREGEVITGSVRRFSDRDIIVDLGKVEAILPYCEQIKKERYVNGSRVKAIITKVLSQNDLANIGDDPVLSRYKSAAFKMDKGQRGPYVILSRANGKFLEELFKVEVPEINEGIVEIKSVQRDPGFRAKVMVSSIDKKGHLRVCRCLENGMDMGAGTILSMTIIAWAFLPVNRIAVPVCAICAPIWCQPVISLSERTCPASQGSLLRCIPTGWS